ncbi:AMP-binding protein [Microbacterium paulum]
MTIGYADLEERARELAFALRRAGYGPGDRVATISGNSIDHVVAFFACAKSGVAFVPLSWRLTPRELADVLERSEPALVLVEDEYEGIAAEALDRTPGRPSVTALGTTGVEASVPDRVGPAVPARAVRDDDALLVIYTSGSEAAPKGVVLTHGNCFWNNLALAGAQQLTADDVVLCRCCRSSMSQPGTVSRCWHGGWVPRSSSSGRSSRVVFFSFSPSGGSPR